MRERITRMGAIPKHGTCLIQPKVDVRLVRSVHDIQSQLCLYGSGLERPTRKP